MTNYYQDRICLCGARYMEIWLADLPLNSDSHVQGGTRPVLVISNDKINRRSPVVSVVPLTTRMKRLDLATHVRINGGGLRYPSLALVEQLTTIDKSLLVRRLGYVSREREAVAIKAALAGYMGLAA